MSELRHTAPVALSAGLNGAAARARREHITRLIEEEERVSVAALATRFGVTSVSIRRDLRAIEEQGLLRRVHGGAVALTRLARPGIYSANEGEHGPEKQRIGAAAAALVAPADVVMFDSGTTVTQAAVQLAAGLRVASTVTAVTHSLPVMERVAAWPNSHLVSLGGLYLADYQAFVGPQTVASLRELQADIAFLGCNGLSVERGITTPHVLVAEVGAVMASRARRVVALADSSKLVHSGFVSIIPLSSVSLLITDDGADPERLAEIRAAGCEVLVV
jgi:DeoR/GlpR family transcriptional regulator of sugar metabolism